MRRARTLGRPDRMTSGGERAWEQDARWGEWQIPNTDLPLLADDMHGQRAIELGCGTGYVSAWMRRRAHGYVGAPGEPPEGAA